MATPVDDVTAIMTIKCLAEIKSMRGHRKGPLARVTKAIKVTLEMELSGLQESELKHNLLEATQHAELLNAFHERAIDITVDDPEDNEKEIHAFLDWDSSKRSILNDARNAYHAKMASIKLYLLRRSLDKVRRDTGITSRAYRESVDKLSKDFESFLTDFWSVKEDPCLEPSINAVDRDIRLLEGELQTLYSGLKKILTLHLESL